MLTSELRGNEGTRYDNIDSWVPREILRPVSHRSRRHSHPSHPDPPSQHTPGLRPPVRQPGARRSGTACLMPKSFLTGRYMSSKCDKRPPPPHLGHHEQTPAAHAKKMNATSQLPYAYRSHPAARCVKHTSPIISLALPAGPGPMRITGLTSSLQPIKASMSAPRPATPNQPSQMHAPRRPLQVRSHPLPNTASHLSSHTQPPTPPGDIDVSRESLKSSLSRTQVRKTSPSSSTCLYPRIAPSFARSWQASVNRGIEPDLTTQPPPS